MDRLVLDITIEAGLKWNTPTQPFCATLPQRNRLSTETTAAMRLRSKIPATLKAEVKKLCKREIELAAGSFISRFRPQGTVEDKQESGL